MAFFLFFPCRAALGFLFEILLVLSDSKQKGSHKTMSTGLRFDCPDIENFSQSRQQ